MAILPQKLDIDTYYRIKKKANSSFENTHEHTWVIFV